MSYLTSMAKNKAKSQESPESKPQHTEGLDLLIVSTEPGDPEPLFLHMKRDQVKSDAGADMLKFMKTQKMPGQTRGWAYTYDGGIKWHQIDNYGTVCRASHSNLLHTMLACALRPTSCTPDLWTVHSPANTSSVTGWRSPKSARS